MYQVSNAFLNAMKSPVQEHTITGTIGSVSFDEANIVDGSFSISNQSTDTSDVVLGSCYVGQLTAEFVGINIAYGKWINKTITPSFGLKVGEYYEYVPLGVYKVKEAKHTDHGVQVTAYDNMIKFDKKFRKSHFMNLSGMTNIIDQLCTDAGVVCGMSHAQIEALPNGDRTGINIYGSKGKKAEFANDITTLRDLLFWVAQTLGCFATINRAGQLEFRQYTQNVVDNISNVHRIEGATFADYITHYVGIYVENLDDNTEDYYGYDTTALTQELQETMSEITEDQEDITDLELDRADWVQKLANHECTQEEYDAAIAEIDAQEKVLSKEINQLSKRAEWLSNAISMSADDGSDMVLGANPLTMAKNLTTRDAQRREILGALNSISYTPFQASVVCGCIYDLGDVIQFSGGLYNSDTDSFGCVMSYTYTHNGGTELEGFGVDPSVVVIRNKTQKSTDRASKNAVNAKESFNGFSDPQDEFPSGGKDGDIYIKRATKIVKTSKYPIEYFGRYFEPGSKGNGITLTRVDLNADGYFDYGMGGQAIAADVGSNRTYENGAVIYRAKLNGAGRYRWNCKIKTRYSQRNQPTAWSALGFRMASTGNNISSLFEGFPMSHGATSSNGFSLNLSDTQNDFISYSAVINIPDDVLTDDYIYIWFSFNGCIPISANNDDWRDVSYTVKDFFFEKYEESGSYDGGVNTNTEEYIDKVYTYIKDDESGVETGRWVDIEYIANIQDGSWDGVTLNYKRYLGLKDYVMRAWYKADPPQIDRDFSQFCVRYTGKPDTGITISYHGASGWEGQELKVSDEGIYSIKCGGTRRSGEVDYVAYKMEGLVSGSRYYFNFAANIGNSARFGEDNSKGLGVIFNTTGTINTNDWSGEPHTFNNSTLYESFYRSTGKKYYDFDFVATDSTMYMIVTVADILAGLTTVLNLTEFVVSHEERKYIRELYLYDYHVNEWLKYKPFGTKDDGSAEGVTHLSELDDVALDDLQDGQILEYDSDSGKWENTNKPDYVRDVKIDNVSVVDQNKVANINTMTGATVSRAGAKGLVPAPAIGDNEKFLSGDGTWKTVQGGGGQGNILYGTNEPTSATGSDGDVYYQYSEEQGSDWTADAEYLVTDAGTVFDVISNDGGTVRHFTKTNNGKAIAVNYVSSSWSGGILVSQDADSCKYSNEGGSVNTVQSTVIDGVTWYSSTAGAWITGARYNTNGVAPDIVCDYSTQPPNNPSIIIPLILTAANERTATVADSIVAVFFKQDGIWLKDETGGGSQAIELTKAQYDALPSTEKNDPNKVYYVTDYPTPSGIDLDDLDDVEIVSPTEGQVLKYDVANSKWVNGADEGGLFSVVDGMVCITYET